MKRILLIGSIAIAVASCLEPMMRARPPQYPADAISPVSQYIQLNHHWFLRTEFYGNGRPYHLLQGPLPTPHLSSTYPRQ